MSELNTAFENETYEYLKLVPFLRESWKIEGYGPNYVTPGIIGQTRNFLLMKALIPNAIVDLALTYAYNGHLRDQVGMNVRVGAHVPIPGGPEVREQLEELCRQVNAGHLDPWQAHVRYETLHPFLDGNGRTGRTVWAWHMQVEGSDPFCRPFLQSFYYQTLDHSGR